MVAVTALLDEEYSERVNDLIDRLEREYDIKEVKATPYPHLTFLTTDVEKLSVLKQYLEELSQHMGKFTIRTTGLGIFPGQHPVIYVPVLRTPPLNLLHAKLFNEISGFSQKMGNYYHPDTWLPHISLALGDTSPRLLGVMLSYLSQFDFNWEIKIETLAILKKSGDKFLKEEVFNLSNVTA
jgi:2'-5' RNA ligase